MTDVGLLTPGLNGPGTRLTDDVAILRAMLRAESTWVEAQAGLDLVPPAVADAVTQAAERLLGRALGDASPEDRVVPGHEEPVVGEGRPGERRADRDTGARRLATALADESASTGNPVIPLVRRLREALPPGAPPDAARAVHTGLTSQDVIDTALMLVVADAVVQIRRDLARAEAALGRLARERRSTPVLARTLAQPAVPTTFGARSAGWLQALAEADATLSRLDQPVAWGGAAGTLDQAPGTAPTRLATVDAWAVRLGLSVPAGPWHVTRYPVLRTGAALAEACAALGKIAADVLTGVREGELREPAAPGRGVSSTMPHKENPVLSVLLRRSAIAAPGALQTLHTAAALAVDERPDGAWHAEWPALRELARHAAGGAALAAELLEGLTVDVRAAGENLAAGLGGTAGVGAAVWDTAAAEEIVDRVLRRYAGPGESGAPGPAGDSTAPGREPVTERESGSAG
jgi:3-carboxy-cis,cis-muconate cycloisomerase